MNRILAALLVVSPLLHAAEPPDADRKAIHAMAGTFAVNFDFRETVAIAPGYEIKKPYHEEATEYVTVVEDSPTRISLQHLLVVPGEDKSNRVIKHWAQIWTWEDTDLINYHGTETKPLWKKVKLTPEQVTGTWSQLVTSVDDSPRYEGYGKWVHNAGESYWESNPTHRPLPRREYTTREDYDYLLVTNRHTITPQGWIHQQDNRKVVDRDGKPPVVLAYEFGLNSYTRAERPEVVAAIDWWKENGGFWKGVRDFWTKSQDQASVSFTYEKRIDGKRLSKTLDELEKAKSPATAVDEALKPFLVVQ